MGFPGAEAFTAVERESLWHRFIWHIRRGLAWLQGDTLSPFFSHERDDGLTDLGYLLLEFVVEGRPLSSTWAEHHRDASHRANLYRGLSRILLDLAKVPLPRIGSWTLDNRGIISLTNRPLFDLTSLWSRHGLPTGIPRDLTYGSAEPYIQDLLAYQDTRLRYQLNSILGRSDGVHQLSALVALRALFPVIWKQDLRSGVFVLTLPDLHNSNIMVDDDWNIVRLIDFEFAPVQPQEMVGVPTWLNSLSVDEMHGEPLDEFKEVYDLFVSVLEEQEAARRNDHSFSKRLRGDWQTGRVWYNAALGSCNGFPLIFKHNIQPRFFPKFDDDVQGETLARLWTEDVEGFIAAKLKDNEQYEERIRAIFAEARQLSASKE